MTITRIGTDKARTCDLKCKMTRKVFEGIHFRHVRPLSTASASPEEHKKSKHHKSQRDAKKKKKAKRTIAANENDCTGTDCDWLSNRDHTIVDPLSHMSDSDSDHDLHPRTRPHGMPPLVPELTEEQIEEATVVEWKRKEAKRKAKDMSLLDGLAAEEVLANDAEVITVVQQEEAAAAAPNPFDYEEARVGEETVYADAVPAEGKKKEYYKPLAGASDMADAIPNGCMQGIPTIEEWVACWAHVWRSIHKHLNKLHNSSDDRVSMLFTDLAFLHETNVVELWPHAVRLFVEKWGSKPFEETVMVTYLQKEILHRRFARCHTGPGKPTDTNTLEAFNRVLKSEQNFGSVEGLANVVEKSMLIGERMSRDYKASTPV